MPAGGCGAATRRFSGGGRARPGQAGAASNGPYRAGAAPRRGTRGPRAAPAPGEGAQGPGYCHHPLTAPAAAAGAAWRAPPGTAGSGVAAPGGVSRVLASPARVLSGGERLSRLCPAKGWASYPATGQRDPQGTSPLLSAGLLLIKMASARVL